MNIIHDNEIRIREVSIRDDENIYKKIYHDRNVLDSFIGQYANDFDSFKTNFNISLEKNLKNKSIYWVVESINNQFIGIIEEKWRDSFSIELSFAIQKKLWNKGYMTRALLLVICYLVRSSSLKEIICMTFDDNEACKKVLSNCGFYLEKKELADFKYLGKNRNVFIYKFKIRE